MYYVPGMLDMLGTRYGYHADAIVKWVVRGGYLVGISGLVLWGDVIFGSRHNKKFYYISISLFLQRTINQDSIIGIHFQICFSLHDLHPHPFHHPSPLQHQH